MSSSENVRRQGGPRQRQVEIGVAAFMILLGIVTMAGSLQVGTGWGAEGPQSGFFPFWVGSIIVVSSGWNLIRAFAHGVDVVTFEFENVPVESARWLAERVPVYPPPGALEVSQERLAEKRFFRSLGIPTPPFAPGSMRAPSGVGFVRIGVSSSR